MARTHKTDTPIDTTISRPRPLGLKTPKKRVSISTPTGHGNPNVPKEVSIDASYSPHFTHLSPQTNNLDTEVGAWLDHHIGVIGKLRRSGIGIVLDLVRYQLFQVSASFLIEHLAEGLKGSRTWAETKRRRGPAWAKNPCGLTDVAMASTCTSVSRISDMLRPEHDRPLRP